MHSIFSGLDQLPSDPIYGLQEEFKRDSRINKLNLSIGVLCDTFGKIKRFESVMRATDTLLPMQFEYLPIAGNNQATNLLLTQLFPSEDPSHFASCQSIGGTGALFIAASLCKKTREIDHVAFLAPTWPNHINIINACALKPFPLSGFNEAEIEKAGKRSLYLLQASCNNPTGARITPYEWDQILDKLKSMQAPLLFDLAYWGFGQSLEEDLYPIRKALELKMDFLLAFSASKSFGIYNCRTGWALAYSQSNPKALKSHMESIVRSTYSSPPAIGSTILLSLFQNPDLFEMWKQEINQTRTLIQTTRSKFSEQMSKFSSLAGYQGTVGDGEGLFTQLPISFKAIEQLRRDHGIYIGLDGRINLAALTDDLIDETIHALDRVLRQQERG